MAKHVFLPTSDKLIIIDGNEVNITTGTENITEITVEKNNNTAPDLADNGLLLNQAANYFRFQYCKLIEFLSQNLVLSTGLAHNLQVETGDI